MATLQGHAKFLIFVMLEHNLVFMIVSFIMYLHMD